MGNSFLSHQLVLSPRLTKSDDETTSSHWRSGLAIGHVRDKLTIPVGCLAELNGETGQLRVIEPCVR